MQVVCTRLESNPKSSFVGTLDVYLPDFGIKIKNLTLWQKNGKRWVNQPSRSYLDNSGKRVYDHYVEFTKPEVLKDFNDSILKAIDKFCAEKSNECN